jgi:CRISPR-associated protein Cas5h
MKKLISIDIFADFGMLKKPDTNEPVYLTFNMLHKPALIGILGAIIGESGFKEKGVLPDYYLKLNDLKVGIQPLNHENGNFQKTVITYNNTTGMASKETGGNLMVTEQMLVAPAYRCYFLFDLDNETHKKADENLSKYYAEYLPYLGKNEFSVWWKDYKVYENFSEFEPIGSFKINSIYVKDVPLKDLKDNEAVTNYDPIFDEKPEGYTFSYFERLPIAYMDIGKKNYQYDYQSFAFTDWSLKLKNKNSNLLLKTIEHGIIQVF